MKLDAAVKTETKTIALYNFLLTVLENLIFLVLGYWDITVLAGSAYGWAISCLCFLLIGISVQKAMQKDPKRAQAYMQTTYMGRMIFSAIAIVIAMKIPFFNWISAILPFVFTRISISLIGFIKKGE